jgi:hypothetical protein
MSTNMRQPGRRRVSVYAHVALRQQALVAAFVWSRLQGGRQDMLMDREHADYVRWCHRAAGNVDLALGIPAWGPVLRRFGWRRSQVTARVYWDAPAAEDMLVDDLLALIAEDTERLLYDPANKKDKLASNRRRRGHS